MLTYDLSGLDVLVVDNNRHMLSLLRDVLKAFGVRRLRTEDDPDKALDSLARQPADLVIAEWHLEAMTGADFVGRLRNPDKAGIWRVPVLLLTGQSDLASVREARDCGVSEFLAKPVSARTLYERIVSLIEQPRQFVNDDSYRGPDRRRRARGGYEGPERRERRAPRQAGGRQQP